jgi:RHS repeat-associated protein
MVSSVLTGVPALPTASAEIAPWSSGDTVPAVGEVMPLVEDVPNPDVTGEEPQEPVWPEPVSALVSLSGMAVAAPETGAPTGSLDASKGPVTVGSAVRVGPASAAPRSSATTGKVPAARPGGVRAARVQVLPRAAVTAPGAAVALRVARADGGVSAGSVSVSIDYRGFRDAYGGGWAGRLRLVRVPECALSTPGVAGCDVVTPLKSSNDPVSGRVSAVVPLDPDPAAVSATAVGAVGESVAPQAGGSVVMLAAGPSGSDGSFRSTDLKASGSWDVGIGSGSFSYRLPFSVPAPPAGRAPDLALSYNSQSVDGRTSGENTQASWAGMGWSFGEAYIERRYKPCTKDNSGITGVGDLCWQSANPDDEPNGSVLTLVLGGVSSDLIQDDNGTGSYHLKDDPGWRIQHITAGGFGALDDYWVATDPQGNRNYFGYGKTNRPGAAITYTNSVWTVPVVGDDPGEPCRSQFPAPCTQAWRWMLDRQVDPTEVETSYFYDLEENWYFSVIEETNQARKYTAGGYLARIDYGWTPDVTGWVLPGKVEIEHVNRCTERTEVANPLEDSVPPCPSPTSSPSSYPDVPTDLICGGTPAGDTCSRPDNALFAPTFFQRDMLWRVTSYVWNASDEWDAVHRYQMKYSFPSASTGTKALWLDYVQHKTFGAGQDVVLPTTNFNGTNLDNLAGPGELEFRRVTSIIGDLGAETTIDYTAGQNERACDGADLPADTYNHGTQCWRAKWSDGNDAPQWDWFRKFVVSKVSVNPRVGADQDTSNPEAVKEPSMTTEYEYEGSPGWRFAANPLVANDDESWSDWRGYANVVVKQGTGSGNERQSVMAYTVYRGLDDDRTNKDDTNPRRNVTMADSAGNTYTDHAWLAGRTLEERRRAWEGSTLVTQEWVRRGYWSMVTAHYDGLPDARMVREDYTRYVTLVPSGTDPIREVFTDYDTYGRVQAVADHGESNIADNTCTTYDYATNTDMFDSSSIQRWMTEYVDVVKVYAGDCSTATSGNMKLHTVTLYDGATNVDAANKPVDGLVTGSRTMMGPDATSPWIGSKATFDGVGRVLTTTTGLSNTVSAGKKTTISYTPATEFPYSGVKVTDPDNRATTTWYSSQWGVPTSIKDPNNQVTSVGLDGAGRVVSVSQPGDAVDKPSLTVQYVIPTSASGVPAMVNSPPKVSTSQLLNTTYVTSHTYVDGLGRVRQTQSVSPQTTGGGRIVTDTWYTNRGQIRGTTAPTWVTGTSGSGMVDVDFADYKSFTKTWYDALGRPYLSTRYGEGAVEKATTTVTYGGDRVTVDPPGEAKTVTWSDVFGRTTAIDEFYDASVFYRSKYTYTTTGLLESYSDPDDAASTGNTTTRTYDWAGRMTSQSDPDTGTTSTTYDASGNAVTSTDAAGVVLTTTYDVLNRPVLTYRGSPSEKLVERVYDTATKGIGRLASETRFNGAAGTDGYTRSVGAYDGRGRVLSEAYTAPATLGSALAGTYAYAYTYNSADLPTSITYPAAGGLASEKVSTGYYSGSGFASSLTTNLAGSPSYVPPSGATYTGSGLVETRTWGSGTAVAGVKRLFTYDMSTRSPSRSITRVGMSSVLAQTDGGTLLQDRSFTYDRVGNPVSIADANIVSGSNPLRECFDYDGRSRLTRAWTTYTPMSTPTGTKDADPACAAPATAATSAGPGGYDTSYAYDRTGNTKTITQNTASPSTLTLTYPTAPSSARPHAVTATSGAATAAYSYHATGEMATKTAGAISTSYAWTPLHELASTTVTVGATSSTTRNLFGPNGTRSARVDPSGARTLYLPGLELTAPSATGSATATRYYTFNGTTVAARTTGGGLTWMTGDKAASVEFTITATASPSVTQRRYTPYGAPRDTRSGTAAQVGAGQGTTTSPTLGRGFLGKPEDPTGLVQLDHRPYDPVLTRFLSVDPLIDPYDPPHLNAYTYGKSNPLRYADPDGREPRKIGGEWHDHGANLTQQSRVAANNASNARETRRLREAVPAYEPYEPFSAMDGYASEPCTGACVAVVAAVVAIPAAVGFGAFCSGAGLYCALKTGEGVTAAGAGLLDDAAGGSMGGTRAPVLPSRVAAKSLSALEEGAAKVPSAWGEGIANSKGVGTRWFDPAAPQTNGIRIDAGNPGSSWASQQVDHVVVRSGGRTLGPDGRPITGALRDNPQAHIPLSDWLNWTSWNAP